MHFVYLYNFLTNVVACIFYIGMEMSTVKVAGCIFFVCQEPQPGPVVVKCLTTNWQQTELTVVKYKYMYNQPSTLCNSGQKQKGPCVSKTLKHKKGYNMTSVIMKLFTPWWS